VICVDCGKEVNPVQPGVYRKVEGWERVRFGGGANQIVFRHETGEYLCSTCGEGRKVRSRFHISEGQQKLL
jgi:DNA-directed RNA polymerase subunit RPC12/RpoP